VSPDPGDSQSGWAGRPRARPGRALDLCEHAV